MSAFLIAAALAAPPLPTDALFVAIDAGGERRAGKLIRLTSAYAAVLEGPSGDVKVSDVISLRRDVPLPPFPTAPHLVTATGDRVVGRMLGGGGQAVRFAPSSALLKEGEGWTAPISMVSAVWLTEPPADTPADPARYAWAEGVKNRDVLRFRNGDTASGTLVGLGPKAGAPAFQFRPQAGAAREVEAAELAAVAFNPVLARPRRPKGPFARVVLADGSRIGVTSPTVADGVLAGEALFGQKVAVPLVAVVAIDVHQGQAVYLSDLKPSRVEQGSFLGVTWPWTADRGADGAPLKLLAGAGVSTFDKGLGTRPRTRLSYDLGGKYARFEALVGLNPDAGGRGAARVRLLVDGKPHEVAREKGRPLAAGQPVAVQFDVSGAKELVLEVDFGPAGSVQADVVWADARVVASK